MSVAVKSGAVGLAFLLTAGLATACGGDAATPGDGGAPAAAKAPKDVLTASVPGESTAPFDYTMGVAGEDGSPATVKGVSSPAAKSYEAHTTIGSADSFAMTVSFRVVAENVWAKVKMEGETVQGMTPLPDKWFTVDRAKAGGAKNLPEPFAPGDGDPGSTGELIAAVIDAKESGPGAYAGTLDLTKAPDAELTDPAAPADALKSVPFTATVDGEGRLTRIVVTVPAVGDEAAFDYTVGYVYGAAKPVEAPAAGETEAAPDQLYSMLGGV